MNKILLFIGVFMIVLSCDSSSEVEKEIEAIPVNIELIRFDKEFAQTSVADLPALKAKYPMFFPKRFDDSLWVSRMQDTLQIQLQNEVQKSFNDTSKLEDDLTSLLQHIKYYFPEVVVPRVYTTTSNVDYKNKIILADTLLIVALDTYLGSDHEFYEGIQKFTSKNMKSTQILPDVATQYSRKFIAAPRKRSLLSQMVFFGKELYLKDIWLPNFSDADKLGYTDAEWQWAEENELYIWKYFVENEVLYSTDAKLPARFISPAPFSKFYREIDNESPGMIGRYLGWKIVRAYMENNDVSINQLMIADPEDIFKDSKYKPSK